MIVHVSILGTRVLRTEDPRFLTTGGVYTADLDDERLTGACQVHFVRATVAHARIVSVDVSAALAAPGVIAVFTGADVDLAGRWPRSTRRWASRRWPGTWSASSASRSWRCVTEGRYQGEDAAELVDIDYEPLPVVVDMTKAADPDAALLFPEAGSNVAMTFGDAAAMKPDLFDGCEAVVTQTILNQRVAPAPMETRAAAAVWGADGRVTAWIPNQGAQGTRGALAGMLGLDQEHVHIITPDVGGAFGAKFGADPEHAVVCWVAKQLGRPARWAESRNENLLGMTHGRAQVQTVTIGGRRDGTVTAYRLEIIQDSGAYTHFGVFLPSLTILMAPGPYNIPNAEAVATSVVTNTTPVGAYRGAGRPEATAAIERAMDLFAAEIGADPAEVRAKNLLPPFTEPHTTAFGATYDTGDYPAALAKVLAAADYPGLRAEQAKRRASGDVVQMGIGLSSYVEITGPGAEEGGPRENATVEVHPDGSATILTGTSPHGQGHETVWAMLASDELGIPMDKITREVGRHRPDPRGRRHRRLAQPAAGRRGGAAGLPRAHRRGPGPRRRGAGSQPGRPGLRRRPAARSRWPGTRMPRSRWPSWPSGNGCSSVPCSGLPVPPSRSARTWPWWTWTPRRARWCCGGW